jgi:CRP/FNR family transcriptional regulator, cyclic AMP receptor protein
MFVILTGGVSVLRIGFDGIQRPLATLSPPCLVGHMGLVDGSTRSATCIAAGHVGGITIKKDRFSQLMSEGSPGASAFRQLVLSAMMSQLSSTNNKIRELLSPPLRRGGIDEEQRLTA